MIVNSIISNNKVYGIKMDSEDCLATVLGCTIENNGDAGILADDDLTVTNCIIRGKSESPGYGIYCRGEFHLVKITNSIISRSQGVYCNLTCAYGSKISGCTIYAYSTYNCLTLGGNPYYMEVRNSILWGPSTIPSWKPCAGTNYNVDYCCVKNGYTYSYYHNISSDPLFANAAQQDFHIASNSPCKNTGSSYTPTQGEADIDRQPRVWNGTIDRGADEYDVNDPDFDNNGKVNLFDYAIFANAWQTTLSSPNWNADCNIATNSWGIDYRDFDIFLNWWLWEAAAYKMESESYLGDGMMMMEEQQQEFSMELAEELIGGEQMLMGIDYNFPAIYLTCDTNTPDVNDEVTVYVKSDWPLFAMEAAMYINGDADIIDAMDSNEAPDYGWDPGWYFPELIDDGWVSIGGVSWVSDANGTVGYVKLRYNSGQVSVYFDQDLSSAYTWTDANGAMLPFSQQALLIGRDPNE